jgi:hypothetical protein
MQRLGIDYRIFVEPQDKDAYNFKNVIVLEQNDQGLGYSTRFAKKYAEEKGYGLVFRIDDDVKGIGEIENEYALPYWAIHNCSLKLIAFLNIII